MAFAMLPARSPAAISSRDLALIGTERSVIRRPIVIICISPFFKEASKPQRVAKLTYLIVIFVLLPLVILMGSGVSWLDALCGLVDIFCGRQSARTIHFIVAWLLVAFVLIHVFEVIITGLWNNFRSMITGRYRVEAEVSK
jgi:thiosulfate reductase cytochrome b subunit